MKSLLLIAMLIIGLNCLPADKYIDNHIDNEDISDEKFERSAKDSSFSEESSKKSSEKSSEESNEESSENSSETSSENSREKSSELIKVPNYGPRAFAEPKDIGADSTANPGELGEFAEGDIIMPSDAARSGLKNTNFWTYRWQRGSSGYVEVPLKIEAYFSDSEWAYFEMAYQSIQKNTCVRFVQYTNQRDYVAVSNNFEGCFANLGRNGGRQQLNLQRGGCLYSMGTPAHELMHALGIVHEQSRPDRDDYVTIHKENIEPEQLHNFDMYSDNEVDNFGLRYGYDSVMHYPKNAFSVNGYNTIEPKKGYGREMGQRRGPTTTDYQKINIMYGC